MLVRCCPIRRTTSWSESDRPGLFETFLRSRSVTSRFSASSSKLAEPSSSATTFFCCALLRRLAVLLFILAAFTEACCTGLPAAAVRTASTATSTSPVFAAAAAVSGESPIIASRCCCCWCCSCGCAWSGWCLLLLLTRFLGGGEVELLEVDEALLSAAAAGGLAWEDSLRVEAAVAVEGLCVSCSCCGDWCCWCGLEDMNLDLYRAGFRVGPGFSLSFSLLL